MTRRQCVNFVLAGVLAIGSTAAVVIAAESWYQQVCTKCGWKSSKGQRNSPYPDSECPKSDCGGRLVDRPCPPPG